MEREKERERKRERKRERERERERVIEFFCIKKPKFKAKCLYAEFIVVLFPFLVPQLKSRVSVSF